MVDLQHRHRYHHFYPRPPRGGRPRDYHRAAHAGLFLSTPSARRATSGTQAFVRWLNISIHALREEGDDKILDKESDNDTISIHALREEGDAGIHGVSSASPIFLSTPSARRATTYCFRIFSPDSISIHALREEGDSTYPGKR